VWKEVIKTGSIGENIHETFFMHKNKLSQGLDVGEHNFLNAYKGRFLYIQSGSKYYIYDNIDFNYKGANLYKSKKLNDFKEFKSKLKQLNLI
jgi:hypothetical protein